MDITAANDFSELLAMLKNSKKSGTASFSYEQMAERFGFSSPRSIAMVRKGQRPPTTALVQNVCEHLKVSAKEREFVFWLAEKSRLLLKQRSTLAIDEKIANYRRVKSVPVEQGCEIEGVSIRIDPSAPPSLRARALELVQELIAEFNPPDELK